MYSVCVHEFQIHNRVESFQQQTLRVLVLHSHARDGYMLSKPLECWLRAEQCCLAIPPFSMLKHRIHKKQLSTVHTAYMIEYINIMLFGPLPVCLSHFDCPMHTLHNSRHLAYGFSNCSWSAPKLLKGTYVSYNTITYFTINRCLSTTIKDLTKLVRHL